MGNFNYLGKDWSNIVFEGRNKLYGAYKLRQENVKNTALALVFGIGGLSLIFGSSYLYASNENKIETGILVDGEPMNPTEVEPKIEPKVEPKIEPKDNPIVEDKKDTKTEASSARTDVQENKTLTEITVTTDDNAKGKITAQDEFTDKINSGVTDSDADTEYGRLKSKGENTGLATEGVEGENRTTTEATTTVEKVDDKIYNLRQNKAEPKEGFDRFYSTFAKKFSSQDLSTSANEIVVKVKFVVEKDGSFTDIQIIDDKHGVGKEAERILKNMPKWKAAEHNGKKVRSMFTLPIKIQLK